MVWESMGKLRWIVLLGRRFLRRVIDTMYTQIDCSPEGGALRRVQPTKRSGGGGRGVLPYRSQGKRNVS